ncbi:major facilitator superfamily permease [Candidatus Termititenax persephonae]|uniref:Major facilitator superfamily permease n=1 Tax=Candidatus Termititenax persephonae TaxID=2218525 RepID=A0A388TI90_9BACT|nr:major facilitator superfamily permease [Candidatus Termititenax persephonae]
MWLVYRLTQSSLLLGLCAFLGEIPVFILTPFAGVLSDRFNKKNLLRLYVLGATFLGLLLSLAGYGQVSWLPIYFILNTGLGIMSGLDNAARQALVSELVPSREYISNALSLFNMSNHCSRIISFSLFGLIIKLFGETGCFVFNTLFAFTMFVVLSAIPDSAVYQPERQVRAEPLWQSFREGARYLVSDKALSTLVLTVVGMSMVGMSYSVTLPVLAQEIFHGDAATFGWLMTGVSLGSLSATLQLACRKNILNLERDIWQAGLLWGVMFLLVAYNKILWLDWFLLALLGHGVVVQFGSNIILQTLVPPKYRGRLVSFYILAFHGMVPFGSLLLGRLISWFGVQAALAFCGVFCLGVMGWFYARRGIVAERIKLRR